VRSTHAGLDRSFRRDADVLASTSRPLSTTERRWLLDQMARHGNGGVAAQPAAISGGISDMISSDPGAHEPTAAAAETPALRAELAPAGEMSAAPLAPARPTLVARATARTATTRATAATAAAAGQVGRSASRAAPRLEGTPYRAVFACAMRAQAAPEEA